MWWATTTSCAPWPSWLGDSAAQGAEFMPNIFEHRASTLSWPLWMGSPMATRSSSFLSGSPWNPRQLHHRGENLCPATDEILGQSRSLLQVSGAEGRRASRSQG